MEGNRNRGEKDICDLVSHRFVKVRNIHRMKESCRPSPLPFLASSSDSGEQISSRRSSHSVSKGLKWRRVKVSQRTGNYWGLEGQSSGECPKAYISGLIIGFSAIRMQVTEGMEVHVRSAKQERTMSQKYNANVKKRDVRPVRGDVSGRQSLVSSSGKTLFVLMAGGLVSPLPDSQSSPWSSQQALPLLSCSWGMGCSSAGSDQTWPHWLTPLVALTWKGLQGSSSGPRLVSSGGAFKLWHLPLVASWVTLLTLTHELTPWLDLRPASLLWMHLQSLGCVWLWRLPMDVPCSPLFSMWDLASKQVHCPIRSVLTLDCCLPCPCCTLIQQGDSQPGAGSGWWEEHKRHWRGLHWSALQDHGWSGAQLPQWISSM